MPSERRVKFRHTGAIAIAGLVAFLGAIPLATVRWYFAPILLLPAAVAVGAWRAGTDVSRSGVVLRAPLGSRRINWSRITALVPDEHGRVHAVLDHGASIRLPAVTAADLPRLVAASGRKLESTQ
jgi:hypothetical protein